MREKGKSLPAIGSLVCFGLSKSILGYFGNPILEIFIAASIGALVGLAIASVQAFIAGRLNKKALTWAFVLPTISVISNVIFPIPKEMLERYMEHPGIHLISFCCGLFILGIITYLIVARFFPGLSSDSPEALNERNKIQDNRLKIAVAGFVIFLGWYLIQQRDVTLTQNLNGSTPSVRAVTTEGDTMTGGLPETVTIDFSECHTKELLTDSDLIKLAAKGIQTQPPPKVLSKILGRDMNEKNAEWARYKLDCKVSNQNTKWTIERIYNCLIDPYNGTPVKSIPVFWRSGYRAPNLLPVDTNESSDFWFVDCDRSNGKCESTERMQYKTNKTNTICVGKYK